MSISPNTDADLPEDPEEAVAALDPATGEDYDPPEVVDTDREATVADQVEQATEVPEPDEPEDDGDGV